MGSARCWKNTWDLYMGIVRKDSCLYSTCIVRPQYPSSPELVMLVFSLEGDSNSHPDSTVEGESAVLSIRRLGFEQNHPYKVQLLFLYVDCSLTNTCPCLDIWFLGVSSEYFAVTDSWARKARENQLPQVPRPLPPNRSIKWAAKMSHVSNLKFSGSHLKNNKKQVTLIINIYSSIDSNYFSFFSYLFCEIWCVFYIYSIPLWD